MDLPADLGSRLCASDVEDQIEIETIENNVDEYDLDELFQAAVGSVEAALGDEPPEP